MGAVGGWPLEGKKSWLVSGLEEGIKLPPGCPTVWALKASRVYGVETMRGLGEVPEVPGKEAAVGHREAVGENSRKFQGGADM